MRYVPYDHSKLTLPADWAVSVATLEARLAAEPDVGEKLKLINANAALWKALKNELAKLFHYKCWYSEAPQAGTDVDIDHYRPKGRVAELIATANPHPGYWWLAFEPTNYRYSCIVANRRRCDVETGHVGGKADHFPIADEIRRAWKPGDICDEEQPDLLDPCKTADVALLTFKEDGEAMPRYSSATHPRLYRRAHTSINYYHLNHTDFVRARLGLRADIQRHINSARKYFLHLEKGSAVNDHAYEEAISALRKMRQATQPYSSFCTAILDKEKYDEALAGVFL